LLSKESRGTIVDESRVPRANAAVNWYAVNLWRSLAWIAVAGLMLALAIATLIGGTETRTSTLVSFSEVALAWSLPPLTLFALYSSRCMICWYGHGMIPRSPSVFDAIMRPRSAEVGEFRRWKHVSRGVR